MNEKNLTLKEEYAKKKAHDQAVAYQEAKQLFESYYLIAEKLDTNTISRIVDSMNGVEEALKEFLPTLKSVQTGLDAAESELLNLVAGKAGNDPNKTSAMLGKAMAFYQGLSEFLRQDLPVLMKSRIMAPAKAQPDQPVGPKVVPAFKQALAVTKSGGFLKRLFSSSNIPYIENEQLAQELSQLTYAQLEKLTQVGKTPAVMPQAQIDQAAAQAAGQTTPATPPSPSSSATDTKNKIAKALSPWITDPGAVNAVLKALA